jgi:tRNA-splicing ligase RtcB (3'-phosphate/5'-hydroxy nucleic acid ligase)
MKVIYDDKKQRVPIKSWCGDIEESALQQALALSNHPAVYSHVALMPDAHAGMGMPIGGVIAMDGAVCPNAVGVDIGCGMCAVKTGYKLGKVQGHLKAIRDQIMRDIPVGFKHRKDWAADDESYQVLVADPLATKVTDKHLDFVAGWSDDKVNEYTIRTQIGTLGGGNHFIEIQKDEDNMVWMMIHSGSRNMGLQIAKHYNTIAMNLNKKWHSALPDMGLAFLPLDTPEAQAYLAGMNFALDFAYTNRQVMMRLAAYAFKRNKLEWPVDWETDMINIHHNYASLERHYGRNVVIHRKGATLAREGTIGIIPGSMGTSSYIVRGKGNRESFMSCSHGAGRRMSRTQAKKSISMDSFRHQMKDIEYTPKKDNLDEAPQAYKDIDAVMEQQQDLVDIVTKLSPLAVIKG